MRIAVLGVGRLGAAHAATLRAIDAGSELRVYDDAHARAREVAGPLGATVATSIDDALEGADAAVIVTPTATHPPLIRRCLEGGIATFCEKPTSIALEGARQVVTDAERTQGRLQIGFQRRFDRGYEEARSRIANGALGRVYSFAMVSCDATPPPDAYVETSGGQFKDQLIHDFDMTRWLFADEVEEVIATGSTAGFPQYERMGDVATSAVIIKMKNGALGLETALRHNEAGYDIHVEIHGGKDTIAIGVDPRTPWRSVEADAPPLAGPAYPSFFVRFGDAYRRELEHFLSYARGEAENACSARDALEALRIAEAATRSFQQRRPVALAEIA